MASLLLLAACKVDDSAFVPLVELGTPESSYLLEADGGKIDLQIYSNSDYTVEVDREASWLTLGATSGKGDGTITVTASLNEGFRRMAGLVLCSELDSRRDTVLIKQKGMLETTLSIANPAIIGPGAGGETIAPIDTNIPFEDMDVTVNYLEDSDWISSVARPPSSFRSPTAGGRSSGCSSTSRRRMRKRFSGSSSPWQTSRLFIPTEPLTKTYSWKVSW